MSKDGPHSRGWEKGMRRRKDGRLEWRFYVKTPTGSIQVSAYGKDIAELKRRKKRIEKIYEFASERITLNELIDRYIRDKETNERLDQRKVSDTKSRLNRFVQKRLGLFALGTLCANWSVIGDHFRDLTRKDPNSYVIQRTFDELKWAFNFALDHQWCTVNPLAYLKRPEYVPEGERQPFSLEEVLQLLIRAVGRNRVMIAFLVMTGVRTWSEMSGVRVRDCDFVKKTVRLSTFIRRTKNGRPEEKPAISGRPRGKTHRAERDIPLISPLIALLEPYIGEAGLGPDEYLFPNAHGGLLRASNWIRDVWKPLVKAIGRPDAVPYELRHTTSSLLAELGVAAEQRAAICGHSEAVNKLVYTKVRLEAKRVAMDKLGFLFADLTSIPKLDELRDGTERAV